MLNPQQHEAIHHLSSPLLVLAGAGSGKTRVITQKIAHLVNNGYASNEIAAITFTNKAAREMAERVALLLPKKAAKALTVCTFHSLGMKILREESAHLALKKNFSILDSSDCDKIIHELLDGKNLAPEAIKHRISLWKNALVTPSEAARHALDAFDTVAAETYTAFENTLKSYHAVDFDDLIVLPTRLLAEHPDIQARWQQRLRYILIDEYQDTNHCQYQLLRLLAGQEGRFSAVGDDDQSIYAWRGANIRNISALQEHYSTLKVIKLEQNYRSSARILRVANQLISHNPKVYPKALWSQYEDGAMVEVATCKDERYEADWVASAIENACSDPDTGVPYSHFAVLYRGNHQGRLIEEALLQRRIPYRISGSQSFYDKPEIKDVWAYLRLIVNPDDDPAFLRAVTTPKRGIGQNALATLNELVRTFAGSLSQMASSTGARHVLNAKVAASLAAFMRLIETARDQKNTARVNAHDLMQKLLQDIDYESYLYENNEAKTAERKWGNVQKFMQEIKWRNQNLGQNLDEIAQSIALRTLLEGKDDGDENKVSLSTLHAAKGLEYPTVYIIGCEEGILPHDNSDEVDLSDEAKQLHLEEERRLMYVGVTRAQHRLILSHCIKRKIGGEIVLVKPSRFLSEMPDDDLLKVGDKDGNQPLIIEEVGAAIRKTLERFKNKPPS